jgi:hypothetical protein
MGYRRRRQLSTRTAAMIAALIGSSMSYLLVGDEL